MSNVACRIFKEQIDLLLSLPSQEEAKTVLYYALINSLNQFENHFDNQIENQNENAYVSVSVSVSELSKSILNLLSKNIVWKEFSNNYGGKREGVGRPKKPLGLPSEKPLGLASENLPENENENENEKEYAFKGKVIKLSREVYDEWKERFNLLDFDYELEQKDIWFSGQENTKNWFTRTQQHFLSIQREKEKAREEERRLLSSWWRE